MQPREALHRQCIGVHRLYDIRSLTEPNATIYLGKRSYCGYPKCDLMLIGNIFFYFFLLVIFGSIHPVVKGRTISYFRVEKPIRTLQFQNVENFETINSDGYFRVFDK